MNLGDFLLAAVPKDEPELKDFLELQSPDGERVADHMMSSGIPLETARESMHLMDEVQRIHRERQRTQSGFAPN